jgi:DNA-directed RNA polymerase specialized sigma24 family protein
MSNQNWRWNDDIFFDDLEHGRAFGESYFTYNARGGTMMASLGSVSCWIAQLQAGEEDAARRLFVRYWPRLVTIARRKLEGMPRRAEDEEDIAQKAFWRFYESVKAGRAPHLSNRQELLALLTHITACQAINQIKHEVGVAKRGGGRVYGEAALDGAGSSASTPRGLEQVPDPDVSPDEQVMLRDCYQHYINALQPHLRDYAELCLAGFTHQEIGEQKGCTARTVDRKIAIITAKWERLAAQSSKPEIG